MNNIFIYTPFEINNNKNVVNENYSNIIKDYSFYEPSTKYISNNITSPYSYLYSKKDDDPYSILQYDNLNPYKRFHTPIIEKPKRYYQNQNIVYSNNYTNVTNFSDISNVSNNYNYAITDNNNNIYHNYISKSPEPFIRNRKKKKILEQNIPIYTNNCNPTYNYNSNYDNNYNYNYHNYNYINNYTNYTNITPLTNITTQNNSSINSVIQVDKITSYIPQHNYQRNRPSRSALPSYNVNTPSIITNNITAQNNKNNIIYTSNKDKYNINYYKPYISKSPDPSLKPRIKLKRILPNEKKSLLPEDSPIFPKNITRKTNVQNYNNKNFKNNYNVKNVNYNIENVNFNNQKIIERNRFVRQNTPINSKNLIRKSKNLNQNNISTIKQKNNNILRIPTMINENYVAEQNDNSNYNKYYNIKPKKFIETEKYNYNFIPQNIMIDEPGSNFIPEEFKILEQIGEGGFGKIYSVEWIKNNKKYAMKKILLDDYEEFKKMKININIIQQFKKKTNYDGVIKVYGDVLRQINKEYHYYELMELAEKDWYKEIKQRIENLQFYTEYELFQIINQLIYTFALLQKNHISHRDIKPQNILILNNIYKICDFEEAKQLKGDGMLVQTIRGSASYMSPILYYGYSNKIKQIIHNTYKSDVFSLGICFLLAASLTLNSIFDVRDTNIMFEIENIVNKYLGGIYSSKLIKLILIMLQVDEKLRPDFVQLEQYIMNV